MRLYAVATIVIAGLVLANCSPRPRNYGMPQGYASSAYDDDDNYRGRSRKRTIVNESIPKDLKPSSYTCYPNGRPYNGPRPPGYCVKKPSSAAAEED